MSDQNLGFFWFIGFLGFCFFLCVLINYVLSFLKKRRLNSSRLKTGFAKTSVRVMGETVPQRDDPSLYVLDTKFDLEEWRAACERYSELTWEPCPVTDGHQVLAAFLRARNMYSFIIPQSQFLEEWFEGVEKTQMGPTKEEGERRVSFKRGCEISKFTEMVESMVMTASTPVSCIIDEVKDWCGNTYQIGISRGVPQFVVAVVQVPQSLFMSP